MRKIVKFGLTFSGTFQDKTSRENPVVDIPVRQFTFCLGKRFQGIQMKYISMWKKITRKGLEFVHFYSPDVTFQYVMDDNRNEII